MHSVNRPKGKAIIGAALVLGVSGCATVGPNFSRPPASQAAGYTMTGDAVPVVATLAPDAHPSGPWWRALGSADLNAVMTQALRGNQTLAAAEATLDRARAETRGAQAARSPVVTGSAGAVRSRINTSTFGITGFPSPTLNLFSVGAAVAYDLDLAGGARRGVEAARASEAAEGYRTDAAYLTLTGNVALQAVRIAGVRGEIEALQAIAADDRAVIDIQDKAEAVGGASVASEVGGRAQLAEDEALLPALRQTLAQARHALAILVGQAPAQWAAPDFAFAGFTPPAQIPVSLPSTLVRQRPDILAAEADLHADTARIGVVVAQAYPDIRLTADFTQTALTPGSLFGYGASGWSFGPKLTAPIFNGGAIRTRKRAAEAQARVTLARYRQTVLTAFGQVADVMTALAHDDELAAADSRVEVQAQSGLRDAQSAYDIGGGARLAVAQARLRLDRARLNRIDSQGRRLLDVVELYAATSTADWPAATTARP